MAGTIPVAGNLSMEDLAATLTSHEQLAFEQVTGLVVDPTHARNLVTTVAQMHQLGPLEVCASGQSAPGTKILSTTVYIRGAKTAVDLFRLPLPAAESAEDLGAGFDQDPPSDLEIHRTVPAHRSSPVQHGAEDRVGAAPRREDLAGSPGDGLPGSSAPDPKSEEVEADSSTS